MSSGDEFLAARVRVMQIITLALIMGVVSFVVVALVVTANMQPGAPPIVGDIPMVTLMACILLAVQGVLSVVVPAAVQQSLLRQIAVGAWPSPNLPPIGPATEEATLVALRQTTLIIGLALLEGACFLGGIAYIVEKHSLGLLVAGLGIGLLLARFPTESNVRAWITARKEELDRLRQS